MDVIMGLGGWCAMNTQLAQKACALLHDSLELLYIKRTASYRKFR